MEINKNHQTIEVSKLKFGWRPASFNKGTQLI